jgi:hypothetical protein
MELIVGFAEPQHPEWSQNRKNYSHHFNKAGISSELAIDSAQSILVWMNRPFRAGTNDAKNLLQTWAKLEACQKKERSGRQGIEWGGLSTRNEYLQQGMCTFNAHEESIVSRYSNPDR